MHGDRTFIIFGVLIFWGLLAYVVYQAEKFVTRWTTPTPLVVEEPPDDKPWDVHEERM